MSDLPWMLIVVPLVVIVKWVVVMLAVIVTWISVFAAWCGWRRFTMGLILPTDGVIAYLVNWPWPLGRVVRVSRRLMAMCRLVLGVLMPGRLAVWAMV